jgi:hypothetical protein
MQKLCRLPNGYDDCKRLFYEQPALPNIGGGFWELRSLTEFVEAFGSRGLREQFRPRRPRLISISDVPFAKYPPAPPSNLALLEQMAGCQVDVAEHFYGAQARASWNE